MSFFNSFARFLGFGSDNDDDQVLSDNTVDKEQPESGSNANDSKPSSADNETHTPTPSLIFDHEMSTAILDGVLRVFNASLPDFLQRSIDPQAQKKALADALDDSIRQYIASLEAEAEKIAGARLRNESEAARAESERLRKEMERLEQQKTQIREQQLSSDRRRRALQDRVKDLEEQVATIEADREQFQLENRSLLNKIKLADVQPGVIEDLQKEIEHLKSSENNSDREHIGELTHELDKTKEQLQQASQTIEQLTKERNETNAGVQMSKQMYTELQEQLTGERQHCDELTAQLDNERQKTASVQKELEQTRARLEQAEEVSQTLQMLQQQLDQVETVIARRDEKIASLKARNKKLREELAAAKQLAARNGDAAKGLFEIADADELGGEEDFECPEWFVSEPGPDTPPLRRQNNDFGYTEPPRRPTPPENDAQLSLF